jgi:hypothetical protein
MPDYPLTQLRVILGPDTLLGGAQNRPATRHRRNWLNRGCRSPHADEFAVLIQWAVTSILRSFAA